MSYPTLDYYGTVVSGVLKIRNRKGFDMELRELEGKEVEVVVKKYSAKRSSQQNKYYWVCIGLLAEYTGYTKNEMHDVVKFKFLKRERVIEKTGEVVEYLTSTTELNKSEFGTFVDSTIAWAAEMGCALPAPNTQFEIV